MHYSKMCKLWVELADYGVICGLYYFNPCIMWKNLDFLTFHLDSKETGPVFW